MKFEEYLSAHYDTAVHQLRAEPLDRPLIKRLSAGGATEEEIIEWMVRYNVLQGISSADRRRVARAFLKYARGKRPARLSTAQTVKTEFSALLRALHRAKRRGWTSAASKLLWSLYPNDVAMYDAFVYRSLVVLQGLDAELRQEPRLDAPPDFGKKADQNAALDYATGHYLTVWRMVDTLRTRHAADLRALRTRTHPGYRYDIRILDRLLWMMGNAGYAFR